MSKRKMPTQYDVAKLAGVSQATVSSVLGGAKGNIKVSEEVKERIRDAAKQLRYRAHGSARAMSRRQASCIGYLVAGESGVDWDFPLFRTGVMDATAAADMNLMVVRLILSKDIIMDELPKVLRENHVDGLVVNTPNPLPQRVVRLLYDSDLPVVFLNDRQEHNSVSVDDVAGAKALTGQLIKDGAKKIELFKFGGDFEHHSWHDRIAGYRAAMVDAKLGASIRYGDEVGGEQEICKWLSGKDAPDALFCYNDFHVLHLQRLFLQQGKVIPEGLEVAGYNGDNELEFLSRSIWTMQIPRYEMAVAAVEMLMEMVRDEGGEGNYEQKNVVMEPKLVRMPDMGVHERYQDQKFPRNI